jgi:PAS domain S-box-containing protein
MRDLMVLESQEALLEAAVTTADAANFVTNRLRSKLQDSVDQIESTARILNDALVICDDSGHIQAFNPAAEAMFNTTAEAAISTFVGSLLQSTNHAITEADDIWTMLDHIDEAEEEHDLHGRRGDVLFPLDVNHTRLDRSDGTTIFLLIMRDTSRAHDGVKLKGYRSIFESSFDGILVLKDGAIVAANPAATTVFGYNVEELLSKSLEALFMCGREHTPVPLTGGEVEVMVEGKHRDGHLMEMFFTTTTIWWNGESATLITIKDITPVKALGAEDAEAMICCFDSDYRITFVNSAYATFYGQKRENLIGEDIRTLLPANECSPFLIHINSLTPTEPTRRMQLRSTDENGEHRLQVWTDHASFDDDVVEYQRIGRDISNTITTTTRS